jgi:hypothetical protein
MNFTEITNAARAAWASKMARAAFLKTLPPEDRNLGAAQFDRLERLSKCQPPTAEEIEAETQRVAMLDAFCRVAKETRMPYGTQKFLARVLSGRVLSEGEKHYADLIRNAAKPTAEELQSARQRAEEFLRKEELYLKARLGEAH